MKGRLAALQYDENNYLRLSYKINDVWRFSVRDQLYFSFSSRTTVRPPYSTVTLLARFLGLSTSVPRAHAV